MLPHKIIQFQHIKSETPMLAPGFAHVQGQISVIGGDQFRDLRNVRSATSLIGVGHNNRRTPLNAPNGHLMKGN